MLIRLPTIQLGTFLLLLACGELQHHQVSASHSKVLIRRANLENTPIAAHLPNHNRLVKRGGVFKVGKMIAEEVAGGGGKKGGDEGKADRDKQQDDQRRQEEEQRKEEEKRKEEERRKAEAKRIEDERKKKRQDTIVAAAVAAVGVIVSLAVAFCCIRHRARNGGLVGSKLRSHSRHCLPWSRWDKYWEDKKEKELSGG